MFTGDTLFAGGCGRLFEGTPAQMYASLTLLCSLPETTKMWFGHEYTASNLRFAAVAEPDNDAIARRAAALPPCTTPTTVALERDQPLRPCRGRRGLAAGARPRTSFGDAAVSARAWWQAARPLAQANLAVPLVLGQVLAIAHGASFEAWRCVIVHGFGVIDHLFIVFANDVADEAADRLHTAPTLLSGGSRVLVQGRLARRSCAPRPRPWRSRCWA
ncbi:MAG: hypothetical protein U0168_15925 [Nannocystaceae bacterium]